MQSSLHLRQIMHVILCAVYLVATYNNLDN